MSGPTAPAGQTTQATHATQAPRPTQSPRIDSIDLLTERAIRTGSADALVDHLAAVLRDRLGQRLDHVTRLAVFRNASESHRRRHDEAVTAFEDYVRLLHEAITSTVEPGAAARVPAQAGQARR